MKFNSINLRHIGLLVVFFLLTGSLQAQSNLNALFNKLGENKEMTIVTISKDMMGLLATQAQGPMAYPEEGMKRLADRIGSMRVISSIVLSPYEETSYNKMIMEFLNDGYKDLMNISLDGGKQTKYLFNGNDTLGILPDTVDFENRIRPITARMCVRPIAKDITSNYDKISEFIVYVREKNKISLIAIEGNVYTFEILTLTKLANLKGILKQTMELKDL